MTTQTIDSTHIPQLRFPEFLGEWKITKLGELGRIKSGVGFPSSEQGGKVGTPFLKVSDMNLAGNETEIKSANNYVSDVQVSELRLKPITKPSLIFAKVGAAIFLERKRLAKDFLIDNNMMAFSPNNKIDLKFAQILLQNTRLSKFAQVGALPSYNGSDIASIKVAVPLRSEQERIAAFLGAVDDKIALLARKKDLLEQYKKGCMQKLFSQEVRFAKDDGSDFPDWEEKRLEKICDMKAGEFVKATDIQPSRTEDLFPCFGANGLRGYTKTKTHQGIYPLIGRQGALCGNVMFATGEFHATEHAIVTAAKNQNYPKWLFYQLDQMHLNRYATGQAQPGLSIGTIERLKVNLPPPDEQKKIAEFLSAIDTKIDLVGSELDHAKAFKKGLLQQMFV